MISRFGYFPSENANNLLIQALLNIRIGYFVMEFLWVLDC